MPKRCSCKVGDGILLDSPRHVGDESIPEFYFFLCYCFDLLLPFGFEGFFFLDVLYTFLLLVSERPCLEALLDPQADLTLLVLWLWEEGVGPDFFCNAVPPLALQ